MNGGPAACAVLMVALCAALSCPTLRAESSQDSPNCLRTPAQAELLRHLSHQDERQRVVIERVNFVAYTGMPESSVQQLTSEIQRKEFYADRDWRVDVEDTVRGAWQDQGYFTATVEVIPEFILADTKGQRFSLTIRVQEGEQFRLGDLQIVNGGSEDRPTLRVRVDDTLKEVETRDANTNPAATDTVFPAEELRQAIPLKSGEVFSTRRIREGLEALKKLYGSKGYIDFTAAPQTDVDSEHQLINLRIELDLQAQYRVGAVEVTGADPKIENELKSILVPGEPFDTEKLRGFFKENAVRLPPDALQRRIDLRRDEKMATVDLVIDLRPCPTVDD